jgi:hypothetical protein
MPPCGGHDNSTLHDLVDDKFSGPADVEPLDLELGSDAQAIDEGLTFCHIVGCT